MKKRPSVLVNTLFFIFGTLCVVYYLLNGIIVRFGQSLLWVWPLIGAFCLVRWALVRRMIKTGAPSLIPKKLLQIAHILLLLACLAFFTVEGVILTGAFESAPGGLDYIVVLGAKVNGTQPSGALYNRIQVAYEYLTDNPDTVVVATGGQGPDEGISEAQCIYNGLTERGIAPERILLETESTSTTENMRFSFAMIPEKDASVGIVTNNFHIFRALRIAARYGDGRALYGVPVATSLLSFPHYMLREFATTLVDTLRGNLSF